MSKSNSKKTVASVENDYGFRGLVKIFHDKEIDMNEWVIEQLYKERGGIKFVLPNAEGKIYLTWEIYTKLMLYLLLHKKDTIKL